ncbi:RHS repeat domain-containing protein [Enterobacter sichuanensis]|uniref:RHS repeat domain-containing protein n=1 Tax=Enterobacter sichuanensis TaxID=2071710 RepID=UPI0028143935|nr:RHS repeat-associated core domain-containing protein [Enterobacter sichuanensis]MDR0173144.1 RHS repeat-associated core domain-containing protein [Enterobacter sichuanensis]
MHREVRRTQGAREQLRQYDSLGRRTLQRSELSTDVTLPEQAILERLYRYTARGELSGVSDTLRGEVDYGDDAEGRLLKHYEARQGYSRAQFSYDAADNLAANDDPVPVTDNRLQHWQALFMKYDHWGNLVSRRNGLYEQHYAYDAENRLVSARGTGPEGRFEARYHYDALGRRTRKIVTTTHGTTDTRFLWQGYRLLQEQQESGLCSTYVYDPNEAWSPLARVDHLRDQRSGEIYWFNTDLNGAPLEVTDERGAVRWSGQYGSFGEVRHQSEGFSRLVNRTAMAHQPLRYAGQYADGETGLHYNLFRYYDPQVGRFIVQDPIGLNGGWNLYQYAPNPLTWIDPLGLKNCGIKYGELDNLGRPTGVQARLNATHINTGTHANPNIQPPGFITGAGSNRARGHLLGRQLGGSGDDVRNLVTIQQRPANTPVMSAVEGRIRKALEQGETIDLNITPIYHGPSRIPAGITIKAEGTGGFFEHVTVLNPPGM